MSKDDFPSSITSETVLKKTFEFMEDWKNKLYDMLSFSTINLMQVKSLYKIKTYVLTTSIYNSDQKTSS